MQRFRRQSSFLSHLKKKESISSRLFSFANRSYRTGKNFYCLVAFIIIIFYEMKPSTKKIISSAKNRSSAMKDSKHRYGKKKTMRNKISPMIDGFMVNELVGDPRIRRNNPDIWVSETLIGMDKIRAKTNVGKYFVDFASSVTVHGFNHLTAPHRHPIERCLAIVAIGAAFTCLVLLSLNFWNRYQNDATIFILESDHKTFKVTKPAILLRPIIRVNETFFPDVFERHGIEDTPEAREFFTFLANATYHNMEETPLYEDVKPEKWLTIIWELKDLLEADRTYGQEHRNGEWIVTERGLCLIFDSTVFEYSSYTYWMQNNWTIVPQPTAFAYSTYRDREVGIGFKAELSVVASAYHPQELPEFDFVGLFTQFKEVTALTFVTQEMTSSEAVKELSRSQRKCKIMSEGGLTMWPVYTENMCLMECKYAMMLRDCGCHPFFARPMPGIPVCGPMQLRCIGKHRENYIRITKSVAISCGCYPNCDTSYFNPKATSLSNLKLGSPNSTFGTLDLVFPMYKVRRELAFGLNDFMASVGGAAGLFLGCSVISFAEFFYWATLRLCWYGINLRRARAAKLKQQKVTKLRRLPIMG